MTYESAQDVVSRYHHAWTSGDIDGAMDLIDEDIACRAPGADLEGKEAYRSFIGGFAPMLTGISDIAAFAEADRVALFYYPETAATTTAPAAEFFTVREGLISESVLIFDRLSYGPQDPDRGAQ
ncbi:nuclear transport factor 2 family protein [Brevibacterium sandarakinum]|uniref:nuclear transport factor 2 family protein n=1 Tax=Brevibacterium sandarakinum TaxID=629680 RepID=UPI002651FDA4|nr:nuclear transport factor 2 family protein [Brevibacterium sandarakinum]MDN5657101.1 nuclear transport factor 2 family protein [Brevibacterium sandarakinum]